MLQELELTNSELDSGQLLDALTGVFSRAAFHRHFQAELARAARYNSTFSLLILDLDHFKSINDAYGHSRGDQALVEFARRSKEIIRKSDSLFRFGGDEFAILLPNNNLQSGTVLGERLLEKILATTIPGDPPISLSVSIGVAAFPEDGHDLDTLFGVADRRHYQAKRTGRSRVVASDADRSTADQSAYLAAPSRLLERDQALEKSRDFLTELPNFGQGVLTITGPDGAGHSRFMQALHAQAKLLDFAVLQVKASAALRGRYCGAITEALQAWNAVLGPVQDLRTCQASLDKTLAQRGKHRLLVTVEDAALLDRESLNFLLQIFQGDFSRTVGQTGKPLELGVVWSGLTAPEKGHTEVPFKGWNNIGYQETIQLSPLSRSAVFIWLRQAFNCEPSAELVDWFHAQTGGLPRQIQAGIAELVGRRIFYPAATGWCEARTFDKSAPLEKITFNRAVLKGNLPNFSNLPELVGREVELKRLKELLANPVRSLLNLAGPGGIGKSRLAMQVAAECAENFTDGFYFVSLAGQRSSDVPLAKLISQTLGLNFNDSGLEENLLNYLRSRSLLLVLDNFETFLEQVELLNSIIEQAPGVRVLVTSREKLKLALEVVIAVDGLAYPAQDEDEAILTPAVQLFVQRSRALQTEFELTGDNRAAVNQICRVLQGLPLAINLAAGWVDAFSPDEIADRLAQHGLEMLQTRGGEENRLNFKDMLDAFLDFLNQTEIDNLSKLAVFAGGFEREAAQRITQASVFFLEGLVLRGLLYRTGSRYSFHEMVRQYLGARLAESGTIYEQVREKHAAYYTGYFKRLKPSIKRGERKLMKQAYVESENGLLAWEWLSASGKMELLLDLAGPLINIHPVYGKGEQGWRHLDRPVAVVEERLAANPGDAELEKLLAWLVFYRAVLMEKTFHDTLALPELDKALEAATRLHIPDLLVQASFEKGLAYSELRKYPEALEAYKAALAYNRQYFAGEDEGGLLLKIAVATNNLGKRDEARAMFKDLLENWQDKLNPGDARQLLTQMSVFEAHEETYDLALLHYNQLLASEQEFPSPTRVYGLKLCIATTYQTLGKLGLALNCYHELLPVVRQFGDKINEALILNNLSQVYIETGEMELAREYANRSIAHSREIQQPEFEAGSVIYRGYAVKAMNDWQAAEQDFRHSYNMQKETGYPFLVVEPLVALLNLYREQGRLDKVKEVLAELQPFVEGPEELPFYIRPIAAYLGYYHGLVATGETAKAAEILATARRMLQEKGAKIQDVALRESFLHNIAEHHELLAL